MRSPSSAPRENGLDGSTETTPTVRSRSRTCPTSAPIRLDLPTPGGPVTPTIAARPVLRIELAHERVRERVAVLDERDRARERTPIAGAHARDELLERQLLPRHAETLFRRRRRSSFGRPRRASISSRSVAMRSSGGSRAPLAAARAGTGAAHARCSAATADSALASIASLLRRGRDREPSRHHERDDRGEQEDDAARQPDGSRAEELREHSRRGHRQAEHGVVRAHDRRERATAVLVRRAALDEEPGCRRSPRRCRRRRRRRRATASQIDGLSAAAPQPTPMSTSEPT